MGVVRVDDQLLNEIKKIINSGDNKYKFRSITGFIDNAILEKITGLKKNE